MLISAPSGEGIPPSSSSALIFGRQRSVTATLTYCVSSRARSDELLELFWRRMPGGILYHAFSPAAVPRLFSPQATTQESSQSHPSARSIADTRTVLYCSVN